MNELMKYKIRQKRCKHTHVLLCKTSPLKRGVKKGIAQISTILSSFRGVL